MDGYFSDNEINDDKPPEDDRILTNDEVVSDVENIILEEEPKDSPASMSLEKNETVIIFDQALHSKNFEEEEKNFLKV